MKRLLLLLAFAALVSDASAKTGEVGVDLGLGSFAGRDGIGFAGRIAARGGVRLRPHVAIEGELASHDYGQIFGRTVRGYVLTANGVFDFRRDKRAMPYLLVGLGYTFEDSPASIGGDGAVGQWGFGSRFWFGASRRAGLRIEMLSLHVAGSGSDSDVGFYTVGAVFRLGKGAPG